MRNVSIALLGAVSAAALIGAGCTKNTDPAETVPAANAESGATAAASVPDADMQAVLDQLAKLGGKPIETLEPVEARKQPTPTDAVKAVMTAQGMSLAPDPAVTAKDITYPGAGVPQKARIYTPAGAKGALPVVLYIHGGGWVIADLDVYDAGPRALAKGANAIVVSIEYRHAPEAKFPAAHDDANAAYKWVLANAAKWGGDPKKIAVAGESAGGNMALNVAIAARDKGWQAPLAVVAVYPVADSNMSTGSKISQAAAKPLNTKTLAWFFSHTISNPSEALDPRLNLVGAKLAGLPPTSIIVAEIDPLHDDGVNLAGKLKDAGVATELRDYKGVTHEFFGMGSVVAKAKDAQEYASAQLKSAFGT
ncbi:alpha/beta hydrolase [soil metagenome]